jgi:hypothetical protein
MAVLTQARKVRSFAAWSLLRFIMGARLVGNRRFFYVHRLRPSFKGTNYVHQSLASREQPRAMSELWDDILESSWPPWPLLYCRLG